MGLFFSRRDRDSLRDTGYRAAVPDQQQRRYTASRRRRRPSKVDLRKHMSRIEDQGDTNSCVANAVAGAYEYLLRRHWGEDGYDVSRLFIYCNARAQDEEWADEGTTILAAIQGLQEHGACSEETWPFDEDLVNETPDDDAYQEAERFLVEDPTVVPTDLDAWRSCLAEGHPIIFGIDVFSSFDRHRSKGLVAMPSRRESRRDSHSAHAMLCVGYSDPDRVFIVRNSWGRSWGDRGYCYIPYDYLLSDTYNHGDTWTIRQMTILEDDEDTWGDDEDSILELVSALVSEMDTEDYVALIEDCGETELEHRMALLMLCAAGVDGEVSDEEEDQIKDDLSEFLDLLGINRKPKKLLRWAMRRLDDEDLIAETLEIMGSHLPAEGLASLANTLIRVAGVDELSEDEADFIHALVSCWRLEAHFDE